MLRKISFSVILVLLVTLVATAASAGRWPGLMIGAEGLQKRCSIGDMLLDDENYAGDWVPFGTTEPYSSNESWCTIVSDGKLWQSMPVVVPTVGHPVIVQGYSWLGTSCAYPLKLWADSGNVGYPNIGFSVAFFNPDGTPNTSVLYMGNGGYLSFYGPSTAVASPNDLAGHAMSWTATIYAVPEPSSLLAFATGIIGMGGFILRRRK